MIYAAPSTYAAPSFLSPLREPRCKFLAGALATVWASANGAPTTLAQQGYTYQQILGHYYQGVQLSQIQSR
jgi:hypothetical protein